MTHVSKTPRGGAAKETRGGAANKTGGGAAVETPGGAANETPGGAARTTYRGSAVPPGSDVLNRLHALVAKRRDANPQRSHSARLLARGTAKVAQKLGEESFECLIEALTGDRERLVGEAADVLYHLVVLWVDVGVDPNDVWAELARREGMSGIAEKAARRTKTEGG